MRAISSLMLEVGIDAESWSARLAFLIRVSMSAMGSVSTFVLLPARLRHSRHGALMGELAQADPAEPELAVDGPWAAATVAARVGPHLVLGLALLLDDERPLGHQCSFKCFCPASGARKASQARTQGAPIPAGMGATEDDEWRSLAAARGGDESAWSSTYCCSLLEAANGRPRARSSARPSSSVLADVVIATSRPRIDGTLS